jgi:hypothetical protein
MQDPESALTSNSNPLTPYHRVICSSGSANSPGRLRR